MQSSGYVKIQDEKIKVLYRDGKNGRYLKRRHGGNDGVFLEDESAFLEEHPRLVEELKIGKTISS